MILFVQALFKFCSSTNNFQILRGALQKNFSSGLYNLPMSTTDQSLQFLF